MALKVLAPLDGSDASWSAFRKGLALYAGMPGVTVTALNVRQPGFEAAPEDTVQQFDDDEDDEIFPTEASSHRVLDQAVKMGKEAGVTVEPLSVEGTHVKVILEHAPQFDVLMMHQLSASSLKDVVTGSRTEDLARKARTSVLLVRTD